jgi:hypothetical protein
MFARYYVELPMPAVEVERALLDAPQTWLPALADEANTRRELLLAEVGFGDGLRVSKKVVIELGEPIRVPAKTILPVRWRAAGPERLFPALAADIEVASITASTAQLSMSARYTPPMGPLGRAVDRALLHRVAEATLKDFLDRVAATLSELSRPAVA